MGCRQVHACHTKLRDTGRKWREREGEGLLFGRWDDFLLGVFGNPLCSSVSVGEHWQLWSAPSLATALDKTSVDCDLCKLEKRKPFCSSPQEIAFRGRGQESVKRQKASTVPLVARHCRKIVITILALGRQESFSRFSDFTTQPSYSPRLGWYRQVLESPVALGKCPLCLYMYFASITFGFFSFCPSTKVGHLWNVILVGIRAQGTFFCL